LSTNNPSWQAKQLIPHSTVTLYGDCVKICEDFTPNFGDKKLVAASRQFTIPHFHFNQGIPETT
jgi:hypothetical protein